MDNTLLQKLSQRHPVICTRPDQKAYVLAALIYTLIKADGDATAKEMADVIPSVQKFGNLSGQSELDSFKKGAEDAIDKTIALHDITGLVGVFETRQEQLNLIKCLIRIAAADGTLDKAEYSIIEELSCTFQLNIPKFEELAEKLSITTSNAARKRQFEAVGGVLKIIGKGVVVAASLGLAIIEILVQDTAKPASGPQNKPENKPEKKSPAVKTSSVQTQAQAVPKRVYRAEQKNCALCSHWCGERQVNRSKKQISVDLHGQPRGACVVSPGGKRIVLASNICDKFTPVL